MFVKRPQQFDSITDELRSIFNLMQCCHVIEPVFGNKTGVLLHFMQQLERKWLQIEKPDEFILSAAHHEIGWTLARFFWLKLGAYLMYGIAIVKRLSQIT